MFCHLQRQLWTAVDRLHMCGFKWMVGRTLLSQRCCYIGNCGEQRVCCGAVLVPCGCRVVAVLYHRGVLSDAVGDGWTGEDAPLRMAATPSGDALVLAMGTGGLMRLDVERLPGAPPRLVPSLGAGAGVRLLLETGLVLATQACCSLHADA